MIFTFLIKSKYIAIGAHNAKEISGIHTAMSLEENEKEECGASHAENCKNESGRIDFLTT